MRGDNKTGKKQPEREQNLKLENIIHYPNKVPNTKHLELMPVQEQLTSFKIILMVHFPLFVVECL